MAIPLHPTIPVPAEFVRLTEREQKLAQYALSHATHARLLDLYERLGENAGAIVENATATNRLADVLELAARAAGAAPPKKSPSVPPKARDPLPSILEPKDGDSDTLVNVKVVARTETSKREEALDAVADELAAARVNARRLTRLAVVLGIIVSLGVIAGGCWVGFKIAVDRAAAEKVHTP